MKQRHHTRRTYGGIPFTAQVCKATEPTQKPGCFQGGAPYGRGTEMANKPRAKNTQQLQTRSKGMPPGSKERAQQDRDRGRLADTPSDIPAAGWKDILWRVYENIGKDRIVA